MLPNDIIPTLAAALNSPVQRIQPGFWQVNTSNFPVIVLLTQDQTWLRLKLPLVSVLESPESVEELLHAYSFLVSQDAHYMQYQQQWWAVYHYCLELLNPQDFSVTAAQLVERHQNCLLDHFQSVANDHLCHLIEISKRQGRSLPATLQTLEYLYREYLIGELLEDEQDQQAILAEWRAKIRHFWQAYA